ncbi:MAG: DUF6519 domain-containing protein [Candidatus Aminicenantes bacterium]|nr:DUF6519 domain-containing protein [Candidatus Aminicenantes bacterium]
MKGDFSRLTYNPGRHYGAVLFQQGRVQLDADLNEQQQIQRRRTETEARDVIGWSGVPKYGGGFAVSIAAGGTDLMISPGRIYVDGILCAAEAAAVEILGLDKGQVRIRDISEDIRPFRKDDWVEIAGEEDWSSIVRVSAIDPKNRSLLKFKPALKTEDVAKLADPKKLKLRRRWSYLNQPHLLDPQPPADGRSLVYLDVWHRYVGALDDPAIREKALGGPDTAGRLQTVWQVKLESVSRNAECAQFGPEWRPAEAKADGRLSARTASADPSTDPCLLPAQAGYRGLENQFYRFEIHRGGRLGQDNVTFKWSRDNGSVVTAIEKISGLTITVSGTGPDDVLGFVDNAWIEVLDDRTELLEKPGQVVQILTAERASRTITLKPDSGFDPAAVDMDLHPKLRRWDGAGEIKAEIPPANDGWLKIENGVEVKFSPGTYRCGDYWTVPARTAVAPEVGGLEWPCGADGLPLALPPRGIRHHFAPLAIVDVVRGKFKKPVVSDCRNIFPPLIELEEGEPARGGHCCTFMVGDGVESHGDFDDIQEAVNNLPEDGGRLCLLPGDHRANVVVDKRRFITFSGCGLKTKISPAPDKEEDPVFKIVDSRGIVLTDLCVLNLEGTGVAAEKTDQGALEDIEIVSNLILAFENAVRVRGGVRVAIRENQIRMLDGAGAGVAIYLEAEEGLVERNDIGLSRTEKEEPSVEIPNERKPFRPHDPCVDFRLLYQNRASYVRLANLVFARKVVGIAGLGDIRILAQAQGGIQVGAGAERIAIRDNDIHGGAGNGIALGGRWEPLPELDLGGIGKVVAVAHAGGTFKARVVEGEKARAGVVFEIRDEKTGAKRTIAADKEGDIRIAGLPAGDYALSAVSPGMRLDSAEAADEDLGRKLNVKAVAGDAEEKEIQKSLAFLRDIVIEGNRISHMGLSGIGMALLDLPARSPRSTRPMTAVTVSPWWAILGVYGNPVVNLTISRNDILRCFLATRSEALRADLARKGLGGISLGIGEKVRIVENRIEDNGASPLPVVGVYMAYGEHIEVSLNRICGNGAVAAGMEDKLDPGFRGGIVLPLASCLLDFETSGQVPVSLSPELFAARVHGNVVSQPVGRALTIGALGPVSVLDNYFDSRLDGPGFLNPMVGAVLIIDLGRSIRAAGAQAKRAMTEAAFVSTGRIQWPNGCVQFQDNQSSIGPENQSLATHLVASLDDVGFTDNQVDNRQATARLSINCYVLARTARVCGNRFLEPNQVTALSLLSIAQMLNTVTGNQGDHCLLALGLSAETKVYPAGNLTLLADELCAIAGGFIQQMVIS